MITLDATDTPVIAKTRELCKTLLEQDSYKKLKGDIDAFLGDEEAKALYQNINEMRDALVEKQQTGQPLSDEETNAFEEGREKVLANAACLAFIEAQQEFQKLQDSVMQHLGLTIESGKVPTDEDIQALEAEKSGGCCGGGGGGGGGEGGGCGCG
jgi:cell fate (sporulation/competence/biofilm development) regulator YlbF (YheA/YmcA/DUF963 family)